MQNLNTYVHYNVAYTFATDSEFSVRMWKPNFKLLDEREYNKSMQFNHHIDMDFTNKNGKSVHMLLLDIGSKYYTTSGELNKLLSGFSAGTEVIIVSEGKFNTHCTRVINKFKNLFIKTYLHSDFCLIKPRAVGQAKHRVMTKDESLNLLNNDLRVQVIHLGSIYNTDTMCIWTGGEIGDIIEVIGYSDICGKRTSYLKVVPGEPLNNTQKKIIDDKQNEASGAVEEEDAIGQEEELHTDDEVDVSSDDESNMSDTASTQ